MGKIKNVIALCGPHRSGKSTLAVALQREFHNSDTLMSRASEIAKQFGIDMSNPSWGSVEIIYDFHNTLLVDWQQRLYEKLINHDVVIADRSPIDFSSYALLHILKFEEKHGIKNAPTDNEFIQQFVHDCLTLFKRVDLLVETPNNIPFVEEEGKMGNNEKDIAFLKRSNYRFSQVFRGFFQHVEIESSDINERVQEVLTEVNKGMRKYDHSHLITTK